MTPSEEPLMQLEGLSKTFATEPGLWGRSRPAVTAVRDLSLDIFPGEVLGLVGESGCGKSTLGRLTLRLLEPTAGRVLFGEQDLTALRPRALRAFRRHLQIVLQDPLAALNPRLTVRDLLAEPLAIHRLARGRQELTERVADLLDQVGLSRDHLARYPHEFSGGQRQRLCIARAIAPRPSFVVADEPLSALDVSVQAQIINLLLSLQEELGLSLLFISHDLNVVGVVATRVAVMYLGRLVEMAPSKELFERPLHPYSQALLTALPHPRPRRPRVPRTVLHGEIPSASLPPRGCAFHPRCPQQELLCREELPELRQVAPGRLVRCHLV
jgi:oligopeptide/dipeptide ABC transporter ATP-binding protein